MVATTRDIASIKRSAEKMVASETAEIGAPSVGDVVRQGDLYLVCLAETPAGRPTKDRQLAPGTSQGSRHVAEGDCEIRVADDMGSLAVMIHQSFGASVPVALFGPVIQCRGKTTITHPEHGDRVLPAGSNWAVVYQRQYAEEVRRVVD